MEASPGQRTEADALAVPASDHRTRQHAGGVKQIAIDAGVSDNIYAIDVETGQLLWKKHFVSTWTPPANGGRGGGILCPGGITATPVIAPTGTPGKYTIYAASWDGMLHQLNAATAKMSRRPRNSCRPTESRTP